MQTPQWQPTEDQKSRTNLAELIRWLDARHAGVEDYDSLHDFSVREPDAFWRGIWEFCGIVGQPGPVAFRQDRADDAVRGALVERLLVKPRIWAGRRSAFRRRMLEGSLPPACPAPFTQEVDARIAPPAGCSGPQVHPTPGRWPG